MTALDIIIQIGGSEGKHLKTLATCIATIIAVIGLSSPGFSQAGRSSTGAPIGSHMGQNNMTQDQFNKVVDYADQAHRLTKEDKAKGKTLADVLGEDKAATIALVQAMPLSCDVTGAMQVAQGPATIDGKTVNTKTYEASCSNGTGYFLVWQDAGKPYGFSCFGADNTRAADVTAGRVPGPACALPENADMKAMGTRILSLAGVTCPVRDYRWVGQNSAYHIEFNEFGCAGGQGYMVTSALPGSQIAIRVETCLQSSARGLSCKFSENGAPLLTAKAFRDALAQHNVACDATDDGTRLIGQDNPMKRYVVEFRCSQHPNGLVAFIPLNGNVAPFEAVDCATAGNRGARCTLAGTK